MQGQVPVDQVLGQGLAVVGLEEFTRCKPGDAQLVVEAPDLSLVVERVPERPEVQRTRYLPGTGLAVRHESSTGD